MKTVPNIINFLYELGTLRKIPRAHMQTLLTSDLSDNISSHSFRVTLIGWLLATSENADVTKVIKFCLLHDLAETRSSDQNWVHKKYVKVYESEITEGQFKKLPAKFRNEAIKLTSEYQGRKSHEARIAKDADLLDQVLLLREYVWSGNKEAERWLKDKAEGKRLFTKTAKIWIKEIIKQNPSDWWNDLWTEKRR